MAEEERAPQSEPSPPPGLNVSLNFLPVNVKYDVHRVHGPDGSPMVLVTWETPIGTLGFFFDATSAETFGRRMVEAGQKSRLVVAGEGILDQIVQNGQVRH